MNTLARHVNPAIETTDVYREICVADLSLDLATETMFADGHRETHKESYGPGYQRDRSRGQYQFGEEPKWGTWVTNRLDCYSPAAMRPIEISLRANGAKVIIDGGGRWLLKIALFGLAAKIVCRVHTLLSRKQEAQLFREFDEVERLGSVDHWQSLLGMQDANTLDMADAIHPLEISKKMKPGVLNAPGVVSTIYDKAGKRVLSRTATAVVNTWASLKGGKFTGYKVDGVALSAVAILIEAIGATEGGWTDACKPPLYGVLRSILPGQLRQAINKEHNGAKVSTAQRKLTGAVILARAYDHYSKPATKTSPIIKVEASQRIGRNPTEALRSTEICSALFRRQKSKKSPFAE